MKKKTVRATAKPAFPAKELEAWFRSEVKQLQDNVRQLQKDFEHLASMPGAAVRPTARHSAPKAKATRARARRPRTVAPASRAKAS